MKKAWKVVIALWIFLPAITVADAWFTTRILGPFPAKDLENPQVRKTIETVTGDLPSGILPYYFTKNLVEIFMLTVGVYFGWKSYHSPPPKEKKNTLLDRIT